MKKKFIIFGATGAIGSSLANQLYNDKYDCHLVGRNETELKNISEKLGCTSTVADVLEDGFIIFLLHLPWLLLIWISVRLSFFLFELYPLR